MRLEAAGERGDGECSTTVVVRLIHGKEQRSGLKAYNSRSFIGLKRTAPSAMEKGPPDRAGVFSCCIPGFHPGYSCSSLREGSRGYAVLELLGEDDA